MHFSRLLLFFLSKIKIQTNKELTQSNKALRSKLTQDESDEVGRWKQLRLKLLPLLKDLRQATCSQAGICCWKKHHSAKTPPWGVSIQWEVMCAASRTTSLKCLIYIYTHFQLIVRLKMILHESRGRTGIKQFKEGSVEQGGKETNWAEWWVRRTRRRKREVESWRKMCWVSSFIRMCVFVWIEGI